MIPCLFREFGFFVQNINVN